MVNMTELIDFIRARLDDDEQGAIAPTEREWRPDGATSCQVYVHRADGSNRTIARCANGYEDDFANSLHIARHDPARELREVDAKRRILDMVQAWINAGYPTMDHALRLMALPYADHPDYRADWRP